MGHGGWYINKRSETWLATEIGLIQS
jgi:hypothetical protein